MRKLNFIATSILSVALLAACGGDAKEFKPALDVETKCSIKIVGEYSNFEALEAEFDKFNVYYPNVTLTYEKIDDYNNNIATVLESTKPNIFFSYTWMMGNDKYNDVVSHMEDLSDTKLKLDLGCLRQSLVNKTAEGKVLMVPVFSRTYGTLVNNNLFEKENLKIPSTWTELLNVSASFKEKGYKSPMMGYSLKASSCLMNTVAYPAFVASLAKNPEALEKANKLNPEAGEYMREALTKVKQLVDNGVVNLEECDKIEDNYNSVILRFFEGDVPMMICAGDTVSGTKKRETQSEAYTKNPFDYTYIPIPLTEEGGYFMDSPSIEFSVNKNCNDLEMTNEFMRFLVSKSELNAMASLKRLVTPTKELTFDPVYAPFVKIPASRTFSPEVLGIKDQLTVQIRNAAFKVGKGQMTIDEAVANYGSIE